MKAKNLFIVITPSQLLNALEFINHYKIEKEENIFIINTTSSKFSKQLIAIMKNFGINNYISLFPHSDKISGKLPFNKMPLKLVYLLIAKRRLKTFLDKNIVSRLILGNYSNFITQYSTQFVSKNIFILDDGTGTALILEKRKKEITTNTPIFEFNRKKRMLGIVKRLMGFSKNYRIPKKLTFFTNYSYTPLKQDRVVFNSYSFLNKNLGEKTVNTQLVYFIGSCLSEAEFLDIKEELKILKKIVDNLEKDCTVIYIPHRLDSRLKLEKIKTILKIKRYRLPIELAISLETEIPKYFLGYFTSALPNLVNILPPKCELISFKIDNYDSAEMANRANIVYNSFKQDFPSIRIESIPE